MNELHVPKHAKEGLIKRFGNSAENMKKVPGCLEFLFLDNEEEDGKTVVFTKWESKEHYEAWLNSEAFKKAHDDRSGAEKDGARPSSTNDVFTYRVIYHT